MPPLLWAMLEVTPTVLDDATPSLSGLRDHVLLLVGFVGALRRSGLAAVDVEHLEAHEKGLVLHIPRSKVNQTGETDELVVLPSSTTPGRCPVAAILRWRRAGRIDTGEPPSALHFGPYERSIVGKVVAGVRPVPSLAPRRRSSRSVVPAARRRTRTQDADAPFSRGQSVSPPRPGRASP